MKLKTTELQGTALDWAVARCEGQVSDSARFMAIFTHQNKTKQGYCWSTDWSQGGPIIEREGLGVELCGEKNWLATRVEDLGPAVEDITIYETFGPTPLVAAMRCYVASKLGDEVEVPDEIL